MSRARLTELLAGEEVGDLTDAERLELAALEADYPRDAAAERDALARVAGALAASAGEIDVPPAVRRRLIGGRCSRWKPFAAGFAAASVIAFGVALATGKLGFDPPPAAHPRHYRAPGGAGATWDRASQTGTLEIGGLEPNDPGTSRYQIWVVDAARPEPYRRVDGGLFDVAGNRSVPIRAKLPVGEAAAFAVTRESPAGAVVSAGPLLAVYAPVGP